MPRTSTPSPADLPSPSARHLPRVRRGDGWDALADIEVFVFAVEAELEAMERERVGVHRRGRKPDLNPVYFENRSFSSLWSRWCLTQRRSAIVHGSGPLEEVRGDPPQGGLRRPRRDASRVIPGWVLRPAYVGPRVRPVSQEGAHIAVH